MPRFVRRTAAALVAALLLLTFPAVAQTSSGLVTIGGVEVPAEDLESGRLIVVFWASWSPRCRGVIKTTNAIFDKWGDSARVITVNFQEDRAKVEEFLKGKESKATTYLDPDGRFSKKHSIAFLPGLLVLVDGEVALRGRLPPDPDEVLSSVLE